ncbi:aminotransferase class III-fold pyridoxal phosphate-dependent enzyme [Pseudomonas sp. 14P_5.3_Bac1]|uniref:aminotransferase class III-fold pyridoxal phosphate-dependent enzyme n=1 Tax=Pseudomonas sp. 14P_5.3_Bac1 TaxID=2971622 RepID=UPI0021C95E25|nr:aminotransferase class III-fold pyridoxal phosphate-dependent enzyme [Pseudomonas sp. 14P_5.3_Bac1]MCU1781083.1 aminotransferase class III-fold pyridoxal phosphate-dependent enzyme [Pseudomonas sp. 14P_5.3_Bac1]
MNTALQAPTKINLVKARGSLVWDDQGKEYIDCTAQAWSNNLGANDPRVVEAAIAQLRDMTHIRPNFGSPPTPGWWRSCAKSRRSRSTKWVLPCMAASPVKWR